MWLPWFITLAVVAALAFATGGDGPAPAAAPAGIAPIATIAERVEAIRGVRFKTPPRPVSVTAQGAVRDALASFDHDYPPAQRTADEQLLRLLGLVQGSVDLKEAYAKLFETQVAGYYDPASKRLRIVRSAASASPAYTEIILAHELTHALEDQRFRLRLERTEGLDDRGLAYTALVEGVASAVMYEYADRHFTGEEVLAGLLGSAFAPPPDLPSFLQARLLWPYQAGQAFAEQLYQGARGWTLIDIAYRRRPPVSTEQLMHPDAYLRFEDPQPVRLDVPAPAGYRLVGRGRLGEWQTGQVLRGAGGSGATSAAAGWGGDSYRLYARGDRAAVLVRWRWDTPADRAEFASLLRRFATSDGPGATAALGRDGVTLAIADDPAVARRLVGSAPRGR